MPSDIQAVRDHIQRRAEQLAAGTFEQIEAADGKEEQFIAPSGRAWRLKVKSYWNRTDDQGPERKMDVTVAAYGPSGWRSWWPFRASARRSGGE